MHRARLIAIIVLMGSLITGVHAEKNNEKNYDQARWDPIHFKPAIDQATNDQCLSCHQEVLSHKIRTNSPAGVKAEQTLAWYQTLDTYEGEQESFHSRHLSTPMAKKLMNMKCSTCHQGNDLREETSGGHLTAQEGLTLRKMVDPDVCLMCHGKFDYKVMAGLPGPWTESRDLFQNNCLACHAAFRTKRHEVNFLNAEAIEEAGKESGDACFGCHGGRSWYRISYPYPRHEWAGMAPTVPDWAKDRPTESQARFLEE